MLNRVQPQMGPRAYKTYGMVFPVQTHFRKATCVEAECGAFLRGWITRVPADSQQADYIRRHSGRSFTESSPGEFRFAAGQTCFQSADHRVKLEREPLFIVRGGDYRGNPENFLVQHHSGANWVEDFKEHQDVIIRRIERG